MGRRRGRDPAEARAELEPTEVLFGSEADLRQRIFDVCFLPIADTQTAAYNVRFVPITDIAGLLNQQRKAPGDAGALEFVGGKPDEDQTSIIRDHGVFTHAAEAVVDADAGNDGVLLLVDGVGAAATTRRHFRGSNFAGFRARA